MCACGGVVEIGIVAGIVSVVVTRVINFFRRRRYYRALSAQIAHYAQQSNMDLAS